VQGNQPWTDAGVDLNQGDQITINASGMIKIAPEDAGKTAIGDPNCIGLRGQKLDKNSKNWVAPGLSCWSLIGRIGDGAPFQVETSVSLSVQTAGRLYLGVNDENGRFGNNSGSWTVDVDITVGAEDQDGVKTIDDLFVEVARKHPGFGEMYIDEEKDTIYVFLLNGDLNAVVNELKRALGERSLPESKAQALSAKYSFLQLKQWHDHMAEHLFQIPEVTMTDIGDAKNRLLVGVENQEAGAEVEKQLKELDIPDGAVNIEVRWPIVLFDSLKDCHRDPLAGGLQIALSGGGGCTLGFIAIREGTHGFVTNSHCSSSRNALDDTVYGQPWSIVSPIPGGDTIIGREAVDPQPLTVVFLSFLFRVV
jgi:PA-IL-like protein